MAWRICSSFALSSDFGWSLIFFASSCISCSAFARFFCASASPAGFVSSAFFISSPMRWIASSSALWSAALPSSSLSSSACIRRNASVRSRRLFARSSMSWLNSRMAALFSSLSSFLSSSFRKSRTPSRSSFVTSGASMLGPLWASASFARGSGQRWGGGWKSATTTKTPVKSAAGTVPSRPDHGVGSGTAFRGSTVAATSLASSMAASMNGVRSASASVPKAMALASRSDSPW